MARIKIKDLPKEARISPQELRRIRGGALGVFFKMETVDGESTDDKHKNEIDILSVEPIR
jgi:hypothetical protein